MRDSRLPFLGRGVAQENGDGGSSLVAHSLRARMFLDSEKCIPTRRCILLILSPALYLDKKRQGLKPLHDRRAYTLHV